MGYLLNSSRPEKALLRLQRRYFRSVEYLISGLELSTEGSATFGRRWMTAFHRHEMTTLPGKIAAWGRAIDTRLFPANSPQQVAALASSLRVLGYRIDALLKAGDGVHTQALIEQTSAEIHAWLAPIEAAFETWATQPEVGVSDDLRQRLATGLQALEHSVNKALESVDTERLCEAEGARYFRLLGGLRGVSDASVAYAELAGN